MKGKLIIIESGSDASGKATQTAKLHQRLISEGYRVKKVEYPNYKSDSSALVKMYLSGTFGKDPSDVSPYIASTFYAVDRYASYKTEWESFYLSGGIILADRYTTSNMVHQAAKLEQQEVDKYLDWLWDLEFGIYGLPMPDCVAFLDMPPKYSQELIVDRTNKFTGNAVKDIHESNLIYLENSYHNALRIAKKYQWIRINCIENERLRTIEEIHEDVFLAIKRILD